MALLIIIVGYLIGAIPTAYIAGRMVKGKDIRQLGDCNMGARNAFFELGKGVGLAIFLIDVGKGVAAIVIARTAGLSQPYVLLSGVGAIIGHNWPAYIGFRGGRGESTAIGVLGTLLVEPMLIVAVPAVATLLIRKNVILASAVTFILLPALSWALEVPAMLIAYSIGLACLVGFTHFLRTRRRCATVEVKPS